MLRIFFLALCCFLVMSTPPLEAADTEVKKVSILPFEAEKSGKYEALKDGLRSMIAGRLALQENIEMVSPALSANERRELVEKYPEESALFFSSQGVDLIGAGQMTMIGSKLRLQMSFYSKNGNKVITVFTDAEGDQQILPAVDLLVLQIEEQVFGKKSDIIPESLATAQRKGTEAFRTTHPDKQYKEEVITGEGLEAEDGGVLIARGEMMRRSSSMKDGLIALAVDDLDGDGNEEICVASRTNLKILRYDRGLLKEVDKYDYPGSLEVHAVNISDLEGDGRSEIYLSAVEGKRFSSAILRWSSTEGFQLIDDKIRFAIRPVQLPGKKYILAGQARALRGDEFLQPGVYELIREDDGKKYKRGQQFFLPQGFNLFDFIIVDLDGDSLVEKVAITRDLKLVVYDNNNNLLWRSTKDFGGGVSKLGSQWRDSLNNPTGTGGGSKDGFTNADLYFVPVRLVAKDGNNDGKVDIIVARNELTTFKVFKNLRSFKSGKVVCMSWNGSTMREIWTTETMNGYVADFDFTDDFGSKSMLTDSHASNNNGKVRLVLGQVAGVGLDFLLSFTDVEHNLIVYEFGISAGDPEITGIE